MLNIKHIFNNYFEIYNLKNLKNFVKHIESLKPESISEEKVMVEIYDKESCLYASVYYKPEQSLLEKINEEKVRLASRKLAVRSISNLVNKSEERLKSLIASKEGESND